jgi:hypothetical protein
VTVEDAGALLAKDVLAYDDLRTGRLVMPFDLTLPSGCCCCFVLREEKPTVCECAGLPHVAQGRGGRPRLEQVRDALSRFSARGFGQGRGRLPMSALKEPKCGTKEDAFDNYLKLLGYPV